MNPIDCFSNHGNMLRCNGAQAPLVRVDGSGTKIAEIARGAGMIKKSDPFKFLFAETVGWNGGGGGEGRGVWEKSCGLASDELMS